MERSHWTLGKLLDGIVPVAEALRPLQVKGVAVDSRCVTPGALFFALAGTTQHGKQYIDQALERGAVAVVAEEALRVDAPCLQVEQIEQVLGQAASRFFTDPSAQLKIAAVTGTDGKSSVAYLIASALEILEGDAALLGTVENCMVGGELLGESTHTTPPPLELQSLLQQIVTRGGRSVAMEASSHGIEQERLSGTVIKSAVLTQLGRDHLDYHGSEAAYRAAKRKLFYRSALESIIINLDDTLGQEISLAPPQGVELVGYSLYAPQATLYGEVVAQHSSGLQVLLHYQGAQEQVNTPLFGQFNASNLLAAVGLLLSWGHPLQRVAKALSQVAPLQGRMEPFHGVKQYGLPLIDYAHTPGALEAALKAVREHLGTAGGAIWVVFGCGGERDRGKRPQMGAVAERLADHVVVTSDNPRSEPPLEIMQQIVQGMQQPHSVRLVEDRAEAIRESLHRSGPNDVVLIAGKGHESTQQIGEEHLPFSDRAFVAQWVEEHVHA